METPHPVNTLAQECPEWLCELHKVGRELTPLIHHLHEMSQFWNGGGCSHFTDGFGLLWVGTDAAVVNFMTEEGD